jgi:hypothetical protein
MDHWKASVIQLYQNNPDVMAVISVPNPDIFSPLVDGFDHLLMVITRNEQRMTSDHVSMGSDLRLQFRSLSKSALESWILVGQDRRIIQWLMNGEILLDPDQYLGRLREQLITFPIWLREKKILIEFNCFLIRYLQAKEHLHQEHILDANSSILMALHHWARLTIIEQGYHPEVTLWNQLKQINPGIYKLYEELIQGEDSAQQRIQLVLLACEFQVMSKMEHCCSYLLHILRSREEGWTVQQLNDQKELFELDLDISLLLKKLLKKGLISEEISRVPKADGFDLFQIKYL